MPSTGNQSDNKVSSQKTLKEKAEASTTLYVLSLLLAGCLAGIGGYRAVLDIMKLETVPRIELETLRGKAPTEQIDKLKSEIYQKDTQIAQLKLEQTQKSKELDVLTERNKKLESQQRSDQSKIKTLDQQLKEAVASAADQKKSYEAEATKKEQLISQLRAQIAEQSRQIEQLKRQLAEIVEKNGFHGSIWNSQEGRKSRTQTPADTLRSFFGLNGPIPPVHVNEYTFEATECRRVGATVSCTIRITNNRPNEEILIIGAAGGRNASASYLYGRDGNPYRAQAVKFGNQSGTIQAEQTLPPGVPLIATIAFEGVPEVGDKVTLRIGMAARWGAYSDPALLKNIPLAR